MNLRLDDYLPYLMRPAGSGIPVISTGQSASLKLQNQIYGLRGKGKQAQPLDSKQIDTAWRSSWSDLQKAKVAVIGIPLDTGAGIRRGAASGPIGVRQALLKEKRYRDLLQKRKIVDLGDIFVNPHLLHDEMLSEDQKERCRQEMYPLATPKLRAQFPVSALSQLRQVLELLTQAYPKLKYYLIGGDHSLGWPVTEALSQKYPSTLGIVQIDAHTDLLPSRLGVRYCFGTWSYHANERLGKNGHLVQVGIRQSGRDKAHWETTTGVKQIWAKEVNPASEKTMIAEIISHLQKRGVKQVYFSNDIDGTDESEAISTGTPATLGLRSRFVLKLIEALGTHFEIPASDVMEVAPDLGPTPQASLKTCKLAAKYALACIENQT